VNRLAEQLSPYLLQHKHNPVDWYAWGEEAFQAAKQRRCPIFLSSGYSTCHWCHVMERDSFECEEVAALINANFVAIKLDREERPDVDALYMDVVVALTGHGGWPLTVFLTPDLQPFYGGTFFPRQQFMQLLESIRDLWNRDEQRVTQSAAEITRTFQNAQARSTTGHALDQANLLAVGRRQLGEQYDPDFGGFGPAPKFPRCAALLFCLRHFHREQDQQALEMVERSLTNIAGGGIHDQLGGGFSRYSTDSRWIVPHFEKMLYDNALLGQVYLETYQATGKSFYAQVAADSFDYVLREMTSPEGGFYSAQDADSEGEEGKFYLWQRAEILAVAGQAVGERFCQLYGVGKPAGALGDGFVLHLDAANRWQDRFDPEIVEARRALLARRTQRPAPLTDDKIICSWNGLMIATMAMAARTLGDDRYAKAAKQAANCIRRRLWQDSDLRRRYRQGDGRFDADLTDYAFLIRGLLALYMLDFDPQRITWAIELQAKQDELFWHDAIGYYESRSGQSDLLWRQVEFGDGAMLSGNGVAAENLAILQVLAADSGHQQRLKNWRALAAQAALRYPSAHATVLAALARSTGTVNNLAIILPDTMVKSAPDGAEGSLVPEVRQFLQQWSRSYLPDSVLALASEAQADRIPFLRGKRALNGRPTFYLCTADHCLDPLCDSKLVWPLLNPIIHRYHS
jgi:hypothetical protein